MKSTWVEGRKSGCPAWIWSDGPFEIWVFRDVNGCWRGCWYPGTFNPIPLKDCETALEAQKLLARVYAEHLEDEIRLHRTTVAVMRGFIDTIET